MVGADVWLVDLSVLWDYLYGADALNGSAGGLVVAAFAPDRLQTAMKALKS